MMRRAMLGMLVAAITAVWPAAAFALTAPAAAPQLVSAPYATPVLLHWTPANDNDNNAQSVYRSAGPCTTPLAPGGLITTFRGNDTTDFTGHPVDGTYCYYIKVDDGDGDTANSPGVTVSVDTTAPVATIAVPDAQPGGIVSHLVGVLGTSSDAISGVASSALHVGAVGACPSGPVIAPVWDTTTVANGVYDVCNVVTDKAGNTAVATATVTVANGAPLSAQPAAAAPPVLTGGPLPLLPPAKLRVVIPRSKAGATVLPVRLRWKNPATSVFDHVIVVLNTVRSPRDPGDGHVIYTGSGTSARVTLRIGLTGYFALYAIDHSGTISSAARRDVSLAALIPMRPLNGSVVHSAPRLTWKPQRGTAYYNVQVFRNGKHIVVAWPSHAFYRLPLRKLKPGTYVWFVWPATRHRHAPPTFGKLIGRATFVYAG
jgi:hypothetical protein